jgi:hypothetical protein
MDYYITELTARLLENGGRYQAQYLMQAKKICLCRNDVQAIAFLRKSSYAPEVK